MESPISFFTYIEHGTAEISKTTQLRLIYLSRAMFKDENIINLVYVDLKLYGKIILNTPIYIFSKD